MRRYLLFLLALPLCAAPTVTVSATAQTLLGTNQTISLQVDLVDPNNTGLLRVNGTQIVPIMTASTVTPGATATVGPIYGNDVIKDGFGNLNSTYYRVRVFTVINGIISSTAAFQQFFAFTGAGTVDLATATPLAPSFMTGTNGSVVIPGSLTVSGASTMPSWNSVITVEGVKYARTSTGVNQAITDLLTASPNGGEVWLTPGTYSITATVAITASNVILRCLGGPASATGSVGVCHFTWNGTAGGTIVSFDIPGTSAIGGDGLYGLTIDCNSGLAATGLHIFSVQFGNFSDLQVFGGCTANGIDIGGTAGAGGAQGAADNLFKSINVFNMGTNANAIRLTGTATNDVFLNYFDTIAATGGTNGDAIHAENSDNNRFYNLTVAASGTGFGLHLTCMSTATSVNMCARENTIFGFNGGASNSFRQDGANGQQATGNDIYGYTMCNGSQFPNGVQVIGGSMHIQVQDCSATNKASMVMLGGSSTNNLITFDSPGFGVILEQLWNDGGTTKWAMGKTGTNDFAIVDSANAVTRFIASAGANGNTTIASPGTGSVRATNSGSTGNVDIIPCVTSQKTETAADTNLLTCAIPAQTGSYRIRFLLSLSAANAATLGWTATWTDSNGSTESPTNLPLFNDTITGGNGSATPAFTFTTSTVADYHGDIDVDVSNAGTSIVVKLTFSGTSFTGKASATIERII